LGLENLAKILKVGLGINVGHGKFSKYDKHIT
jgi:hypothetical protein